VSFSRSRLFNGTTYSYTYNGRPIESRIIWTIERRHFQSLSTTPTPSFKVAILWRWISHKRYIDLQTPYSKVSFPMTLSDLEWLSKIFSDTKPRAVSLWQLSFLSCITFRKKLPFWTKISADKRRECWLGV